MHRLSLRRALAVTLCLTSLWVLTGLSWAQTDPASTDAGRSFEPVPSSRSEFGVKPPPNGCFPQRNPSVAPEEECDGQKRFVLSGEDNIYVETYLPATLPGGPEVPASLPTVLIMSPYTTFDRAQQVERHDFWTKYLVPRGYAVAIGHVIGTGSSDGCQDYQGPSDVAATAHVIDYLGNAAPWTNGRVGMVGLSADATTQIGAATLGDPSLTEPLKAIVPVDGVTGAYDFLALDGVPNGTGVLSEGAMVGIGALPGEALSPGQASGRLDCAQSHLEAGASVDVDGNLTPYWAQREYRRGVGNVRAATLLVQGFADTTVYPNGVIGFFDRLPSEVPHKLMLGQWAHAWPDRHAVRDELPRSPSERIDFPQMVQAWFDKFLMGLETGAEDWPEVQVQDSTGQWRAEPDWPSIDGTFGQLPLGFPLYGPLDGDTNYSETPSFKTRPVEMHNSQVYFESDPLDGDLRISGQPVLDLTVQVRNPEGIGDAHVAASVQAYGPDGAAIAHAPIYGARSLQHLDPIPNGYFEQLQPVPAPLEEPIRVVVRLMPTELVVPAGGYLAVRVGAATLSDWPIALMPSGANSEVEILTSCDHPSVLRFAMPRPDADLLNVRESHEAQYPQGSLPSQPTDAPISVDGGGLASSSYCDNEPIDPQDVIAGDNPSLEDSALVLSYDRVQAQASLTARLSDAGTSAALPDRTIHFFLNGSELGSAVTNLEGVATLTLSKKLHRGDVASVVFDGDAEYDRTHAEYIAQ